MNRTHAGRLIAVLLAGIALCSGTLPCKADTPMVDVSTENEVAVHRKEIKRVLVIGDSHSAGYFGRRLHKTVREAYPKAKVTLIGACAKAESGFLRGSPSHCGVITINHRGRLQHVKGCNKNPCTEADGPKCPKRACRAPKLRTLLRQVKPDLTIVQIGGNSWFVGNLEKGWGKLDKRILRVSDLIGKANSACLWVTPGDHFYWPGDSQDAFAAHYEKTLEGRCTVFNSRPSHRPYLDYAASVEAMKLKRKQHDGIHYGWFRSRGRRIAGQWAADIVSLARQITHPTKQRAAENSENRPPAPPEDLDVKSPSEKTLSVSP